MIHFVKGNIFESKAYGIINAVNTVGVMGGGIALEFKKRFPKNYSEYKIACSNKSFIIGTLLIVQETDNIIIINFPTKVHWKNPSQYEYIQSGLVALKNYLNENPISSIAIPALGCGLGGLKWERVRAMLIDSLNDITETEFYIFEPLN